MIRRLINIKKNNSLFLFGARGAGKTTLIREAFLKESTPVLWIDLLKDEDEEEYARSPSRLAQSIEQQKPEWVIIDEVQKHPKILDTVHLEIEKKKVKFILTVSSARKLKRGRANLLAGRAFLFNLFPFTYKELGDKFDLTSTLNYGTLPMVHENESVESKQEYLRSYTKTYLKEEIIAEQIVRKVDSFRDFLPIAAKNNGELLNYSKIAREVGVDDKTVESYYQILEDTLIAIRLPAYHKSIRKRQHEAPRYYFFDLGVKRALEQTLKTELTPNTYAYGKAFEHYIIIECYRLNEYLRLDYHFFYLRTKDGAEIDLIISRPGKKLILIKIKSAHKVFLEDVTTLNNFVKDWPTPVDAYVISQDDVDKKLGEVISMHWKKALDQIFDTISHTA